MATATKTRPVKTERSNVFTFEGYVMNTLDQIQTDMRELRSNMNGLQRWVVMAAITLFLGLLGLMTFFYDKLDTKIDKKVDKLEIKIDKNTQAIHNIEKKLDRLEIEIKSELKEILKRLPKSSF